MNALSQQNRAGGRFAAVVVVKDEASLILEWLAFHLAVGFDELIVFDNGSTDGTWEIVEKAARNAAIHPIRWSSRDPAYQSEAYDYAVKTFGSRYEWMLFIDSDEFFAPIAHGNVQAFVASLPTCSAIAINWAVFGSSGFKAAPPGLVIENYLHRAVDWFGPNQHTKMLLKPASLVRFLNPHVAEVADGCCDVTGRPVEWLQLGILIRVEGLDVCRINHYFTRSSEDWARKLSRGNPNVERSPTEFEAYDQNEVADSFAAERWGAPTRDIMSSLAA